MAKKSCTAYLPILHHHKECWGSKLANDLISMVAWLHPLLWFFQNQFTVHCHFHGGLSRTYSLDNRNYSNATQPLCNFYLNPELELTILSLRSKSWSMWQRVPENMHGEIRVRALEGRWSSERHFICPSASGSSRIKFSPRWRIWSFFSLQIRFSTLFSSTLFTYRKITHNNQI